MELLTVVKGVQLGYSCDLQQDKPALWRSLDTVRSTVSIMRDQVYDESRAEEACWTSFATGTELANYLVVDRGLPFRGAYQITGSVIRALGDQKRDLRDAARVAALLEESGVAVSADLIRRVLDPREVLSRQTSEGSTGPRAMEHLLDALAEELRVRASTVNGKEQQIKTAFARSMRICDGFVAGGDLKALVLSVGTSEA